MSDHAGRRPLPGQLTPAERDFYAEMRRLVDASGLSFRALEKVTSATESNSGSPTFYSKSQWGRWLNGQSRPPRKAVRQLAGNLRDEDIEAAHLVDLWGRAFIPDDPRPAPEPVVDRRSYAGFLANRDHEKALLTELVGNLRQGRGGPVLIEGEPGIGKSTLVRAALAEFARPGDQVFWGAGDELSQALPLLPFLDALGVREPSANPRRNTIMRLLRGEMPTDRGTDGPALLAEQLLALIAEQCAERPAILVVDDLQWADSASVTLWGRLARSAPHLPLLLVGMMRPVPQRDDLLALRRLVGDSRRLPLAALPPGAVASLVTELAGAPPDGSLLKLADGAAGNPLYLTELVAALARGTRLTKTASGAVTLTSGPVPSSLSAAIADRLDFVAGPTREVLKAAALLGTEFAVSDLAIVLRRDVPELIAPVDEACTAGVLAEAGDALGFRHPLIRAALYEEMPAPIRAAWHHDAGRALAEAGAPSDRVARQLLWAVRGSGEAAEPIGQWVVNWLASTADSLVAQAPGVAAELLARALGSSGPGSARHSWLASRLADALYRVGDRDTAEQVVNRVLGETGEPDVLVDLHWTLAQCRMLAGSGQESLATLDQALATPGLSARHRARLLVLAARTHGLLGQLETSGLVADRALAAATEAGDNGAMGWALHELATLTGLQGNAADALVLYDRALAVAQDDPMLTDLWLLLQINKAIMLGCLDQYERAFAAARQARQLAAQLGTTFRLSQAHGALGQLLFETGRWDEALTELNAVPHELKEPGAACGDLGIAAVVCFHRGDIDAARQHLAAAAGYAERFGRLVGPYALARSLDREQRGARAEALAALTQVNRTDAEGVEELELESLLADAVRLAVETGDLTRARGLAGHATELAAGSGIPHRQANALYCHGLLDRDAGSLIRAAERYGDAGRPLPQAMALAAAAELYIDAGDHGQARDALAAAKTGYTALGAATDLARLPASFDLS